MRIIRTLRKQKCPAADESDCRIVKEIIRDVRLKGDSAVKYYTKRYDTVNLRTFEISRSQVKEAYKAVGKPILRSLKEAADRIKSFARIQYRQYTDIKTEEGGILLGQKIVPLQKVGCYVPGGRYPLPSSALMSIIPAGVAGVKEIIVCSPRIQPITIVAADIAGADRIFSIGGAQAIAAMAYGTKSVPKVDKIVGPGNKYVALAKKEVYGTCGIDFLAGPSEILIIADNTANPVLIAADLLSQAEHDVAAIPNLVTTSASLAKKVNYEVKKQLSKLVTKPTAQLALKNGAIILVKTLRQAISLANDLAPEHLEIMVENPDMYVSKLTNYGSLFIGSYSAEVFGDYCSGTNHILPTGGAARYSGGLSVREFIKVLTYQKVSRKGAKKLAGIASGMAKIEGLEAHRIAAEMRVS